MTWRRSAALTTDADEFAQQVCSRLAGISGLPSGTILFGLDPAVFIRAGDERPLVVVPMLVPGAPIGRLGRAALGIADGVVPMHLGEALRAAPFMRPDCVLVLPARPASCPTVPPSPVDASSARLALLESPALVEAAPQIVEPLNGYDAVGAVTEACVEALLASS